MFLLSVVSFLLNLVALTLPEFMVMSPIFDTDGLHFWLLILITTDVGLAIGSKTSNRVVLIPWLVAYMIHIVITCIIAPFILLAATEALRHARSDRLTIRNRAEFQNRETLAGPTTCRTP